MKQIIKTVLGVSMLLVLLSTMQCTAQQITSFHRGGVKWGDSGVGCNDPVAYELANQYVVYYNQCLDKFRFWNGTTWRDYGDSGGSTVTFGSSQQIPYINGAGNDFIYNSQFKFDGFNLVVDNINDGNFPNKSLLNTSSLRFRNDRITGNQTQYIISLAQGSDTIYSAQFGWEILSGVFTRWLINGDNGIIANFYDNGIVSMPNMTIAEVYNNAKNAVTYEALQDYVTNNAGGGADGNDFVTSGNVVGQDLTLTIPNQTNPVIDMSSFALDTDVFSGDYNDLINTPSTPTLNQSAIAGNTITDIDLVISNEQQGDAGNANIGNDRSRLKLESSEYGSAFDLDYWGIGNIFSIGRAQADLGPEKQSSFDFTINGENNGAVGLGKLNTGSHKLDTNGSIRANGFDANSNKVTNVANATLSTDAVNKSQLDAVANSIPSNEITNVVVSDTTYTFVEADILASKQHYFTAPATTDTIVATIPQIAHESGNSIYIIARAINDVPIKIIPENGQINQSAPKQYFNKTINEVVSLSSFQDDIWYTHSNLNAVDYIPPVSFDSGLILNGTFDNATNLDPQSDWTISGGVATGDFTNLFDDGPAPADLYFILDSTPIDGNTYDITFTCNSADNVNRLAIKNRNINDFTAYISSGPFQNYANGTHTVTVTFDAKGGTLTNQVGITGSTGNADAFTIDNVSLIAQ